MDKCVESMFHELQSHRAHVYELDSVYINTDDPHTRNFAASKPFKCVFCSSVFGFQGNSREFKPISGLNPPTSGHDSCCGWPWTRSGSG